MVLSRKMAMQVCLSGCASLAAAATGVRYGGWLAMVAGGLLIELLDAMGMAAATPFVWASGAIATLVLSAYFARHRPLWGIPLLVLLTASLITGVLMLSAFDIPPQQ